MRWPYQLLPLKCHPSRRSLTICKMNKGILPFPRHRQKSQNQLVILTNMIMVDDRDRRLQFHDSAAFEIVSCCHDKISMELPATNHLWLVKTFRPLNLLINKNLVYRIPNQHKVFFYIFTIDFSNKIIKLMLTNVCKSHWKEVKHTKNEKSKMNASK